MLGHSPKDTCNAGVLFKSPSLKNDSAIFKVCYNFVEHFLLVQYQLLKLAFSMHTAAVVFYGCYLHSSKSVLCVAVFCAILYLNA